MIGGRGKERMLRINRNVRQICIIVQSSRVNTIYFHFDNFRQINSLSKSRS